MAKPKPVLRSADAEQDLIRLWLHIAEHDVDAADRYIRRIKSACDHMASFPDQGTARPDLGPDARKLVVGHYVVFYDNLEDSIVVLRDFHGKEDVDPFLEQREP